MSWFHKHTGLVNKDLLLVILPCLTMLSVLIVLIRLSGSNMDLWSAICLIITVLLAILSSMIGMQRYWINRLQQLSGILKQPSSEKQTQQLTEIANKDFPDTFIRTLHTLLERLHHQSKALQSQYDDKNTHKDQFFAAINHELRTPLNALMGASQLLKKTSLDEHQQTLLDMVFSSSKDLLQRVDDMLDFSSLSTSGQTSMKVVRFDLYRLLANIFDKYSQKMLAHHLNIDYWIVPGIPLYLAGDAQLLQQILEHLLDSLAPISNPGDVLIKWSVADSSEEMLLLKCELSLPTLDMDQQHLMQLFEPFNRMDGKHIRRSVNTGIRLATCRKLVSLMGGEISAEPISDNGLYICFTLNLQNSCSEHVLHPPLPSAHPVLVVTPGSQRQQILRSYLNHWQVEYHITGNGAEALDRLQTAAGNYRPYQLLIVDWHAADESIVRLLKALDESPTLSVHTRIVLLVPSDKESCQQMEPLKEHYHLLTHPVHPGALYQIMGTLLNHVDDDRQIALSYNDSTNEKQASAPVFNVDILLVEDNKINQQIAVLMLQELQCKVTAVNDGVEALQVMSETRFDLVLMDCEMPRMDGLTATRHIREREHEQPLRYPYTPIVALTAHAMEGDRQHCLVAGMDDFLSKPFTHEQLTDVLKKWVYRRGALEEILPGL